MPEGTIDEPKAGERSASAAQFFASASNLVFRVMGSGDKAEGTTKGRRADTPAGAVTTSTSDSQVPAVAAGGGRSVRPAGEPGGAVGPVERPRPSINLSAGERGRLRSAVIFLVFFIGPALFGIIYYTMFASDRFVTEVRFAIKSSESRHTDMLSMLTGLPNAGGGGGIQESYLVVAYMTSREAVEELERKVDLRAIYSSPKADWLYRFDRNAPLDDLVEYWTHRLTTAVDLQSNSISLEIQAFTPEDAKRIADELLAMAERLINDINVRAHEDAVRFATEQLGRAETRLDASRQALREFRDWQANLDPGKTADAAMATVGTLTTEKLQLEQELAQRRRLLQPNSPIILDLTGRIAKVQEQIDAIRATVTAPNGARESKVLSSQIGRFEQLQNEQEFARKLYEAALGSLEQARATANKQQLFIVPFVRPAIAERPKYPDRPIAVVTVILSAMALWITVLLVSLGIRDHLL